MEGPEEDAVLRRLDTDDSFRLCSRWYYHAGYLKHERHSYMTRNLDFRVYGLEAAGAAVHPAVAVEAAYNTAVVAGKTALRNGS